MGEKTRALQERTDYHRVEGGFRALRTVDALERPSLDHASASSMPDTGSLFVTARLFDRIVASPCALLVIDTPRVAEVVAQFRRFAVRSGCAVYICSEQGAITSLREGGVPVTASARPQDALRFILGRQQFGVYLFPGLAPLREAPAARAQILPLLRTIGKARQQGANARKLVLIDARVSLPADLEAMVERFLDDSGSAPRLRLRDGRWVPR